MHPFVHFLFLTAEMCTLYSNMNECNGRTENDLAYCLTHQKLCLNTIPDDLGLVSSLSSKVSINSNRGIGKIINFMVHNSVFSIQTFYLWRTIV